ncbi:MAG: hypothetical protein LBC68_11620 [Prevotellaceae bacterium]|jgi:uncharacterized membrane protein|nr:hypothetical protein [Prevotellaceae bacterium]
MKKVLAHTLTLIVEFIILGLAIAWLCSGNAQLEPMIAVFTSIAAIIGSVFSRSKKNNVKLKNSNGNTIIQDNSGNININK